MKLKSLVLLMALVLFAAACGSQQGSEQTVAEDRAAAGGEEEKSQELRRISRLEDPTERIQKLEAFIQAHSGDPIVSRAQSSLLRALAEEDPKRAVELADQMLQDPEADTIPSSRMNATMFKFIAYRNMEDREAMEKMGAQILASETDVRILQQAANFDETHAEELIEKALSERAKDESPDTYPTIADLHSFYARILSKKKEGKAALEHMEKAIQLTKARISEIESASDEKDQRRLDRSRRGLNRMYQSMADLCAEAGQAKKGLQYLEMAEKAVGENDREQIPRLAKTRAKLYQAMNDSAKALDSYIQAFAFQMSRDTWQKIEALADKKGKNLDEIRASARERRLAQAATFRPFELKTLSGETRGLEDLQAKVTLVNFFFPT
jgi:hypothetical protein